MTTMERMPWFKWWDGTCADAKLRMLAEEAHIPVASVLGVWAYLLEKASKSADRGVIVDIDLPLMAYVLQMPAADIETVRNGMKRYGLVTETGVVSKWEERQAKREKYEPSGSSTKRVQALRAREKAKQNKGLGEVGEGDDDVTDVTDETAGNGTKRHKKKRKKKKEDIKPKPSSSSGDDGATPKPFDRFWSAYPRKVGKMAAQKAWIKIKPDTELVDTILAAITAQLEGADWKRDDGEFIPHGSTWLNGGRWMDEVRPYVAPAVRRANDPWWESKEAMEAKGRSLNPQVLPLVGDTMGSYRRRIQEAIERGDAPAPIAKPTVYVPPAPVGGESVLTTEQQAARRAEMLALVGSRKHATAGAA